MDEQQFDELEQSSELNQGPSSSEQRKIQNRINSQNNAQAINTALEIGSNYNAYLAAAKKANDLSGGRLADAAGKITTAANKASLGGRAAQQLINKANESGTSDRIQKAVNAKNGKAPISGASSANSADKNKVSGKTSGNQSGSVDEASKFARKEVEEQASDGGGANFRTSFKVVVIGLIAMIPITVVMVVICLFTSASQIMINSIGLGNADALRGNEDDIDKLIDKKLDELDDEATNQIINDSAYNYVIDDSYYAFRNSKLEQYNLVQVASTTTYLRRKYSEASLEELEDFYPEVVQYAKANNTDTVYDFFFKLYYVYQTYKKEYDVILDLPLLMATLNVQSSDNVVVFSSNLSPEDKKPNKRPESDFYYDKDWSFYEPTQDNSGHDIEILAQHMVSLQATEYCMDSTGKWTKKKTVRDSEIGNPSIVCAEGETYGITESKIKEDEEKYREFLKEFIEKKYFINGNNTNKNTDSNTNTNTNTNETNNSGQTNPQNYTPTDSSSWRGWRQCNAPWSDLEVGKSGKNMCSIGCLITSVSIQISRSGTYTKTKPIDPGVAVKYFEFTSGGGLYWDSPSNLAPNFKYVGDKSLVGLNKSQVAQKLASYDPSKYYLILSVSRKDRNSGNHYVAFDYVDLNTNDVYMIDTVSDTANVYDIYKIYTAYVYEKKD